MFRGSFARVPITFQHTKVLLYKNFFVKPIDKRIFMRYNTHSKPMTKSE